jgi:proteasome maturation protein
MDLRIVPTTTTKPAPQASTEHTQYHVHDGMRFGARSMASEWSASTTSHPVAATVHNWDVTRDNLKLGMYRQIYGLSAPLLRLMERESIHKVGRLGPLQSSNLGMDILLGRDETVDFEDVFAALDTPRTVELDVHRMMEVQMDQ